ncbi:MFS transporter [Aeromonas dhakensis]|uniref:MFS transporter n=1 Tax=Aeromonas dhakensis TaxID=196024 RepID=UPI00311CA345
MTLARFLSPLTSLVIFILGHGMFNTLLTVRLSAEQVSAQAIGLVSAAYFGGLVLGAFVNARLIIRVGHIRAYAAYASLLCFLFLLHGMVVEPLSWAALRLVGGFATGGLFVVLESWMLVSSTPANRGRLMSLYMILLYGSLALGQLLLKWVDPMVLTPFALCAMAATLSVIPLAISRVATPAMVAPQPVGVLELVRLTPAGMGSSFTSGLVLGAIYGLLPLYFTDSGSSLSQVAEMMALVILGGMCLQYPIGRLSDRYDRRGVILLLGAVLALLALLMVLLPDAWRGPAEGGLVFLLGGDGVLHLSPEPQPRMRRAAPGSGAGGQSGAAARLQPGGHDRAAAGTVCHGAVRARGAVCLLCPLRSAAGRLSRLAQAATGPHSAGRSPGLHPGAAQYPHDGGAGAENGSGRGGGARQLCHARAG